MQEEAACVCCTASWRWPHVWSMHHAGLLPAGVVHGAVPVVHVTGCGKLKASQARSQRLAGQLTPSGPGNISAKMVMLRATCAHARSVRDGHGGCRELRSPSPWRGGVGERSEPGGASFATDHPTPTAFASLRQSTLPLQGRVIEQAAGGGVHIQRHSTAVGTTTMRPAARSISGTAASVNGTSSASPSRA